MLGHGSGFDSPGFRGVQKVTPPLGAAFHAARERAGLTLAEVYTLGREHEDLYQLAELLIEWDERVVVWRARHFVVVERIIGGSVIGTQGTPVEVLGRLIHKRFFPELWEVRNELTAMSLSAASDAEASSRSAAATSAASARRPRSSARARPRTTPARSWTSPGTATSAGSTPPMPTAAAAASRSSAAGAPTAAATRCITTKVYNSGHRRPGRPRALARADQAQRRGQPRAARRRPDRPLPRPRPRPRDTARRDRGRLRGARRTRARSGPGASRTTTPPRVGEALAHGRPALIQNAYSHPRPRRRGRAAAALRRARHRLRAVRPARRGLAGRQVQARRAVPGRLADDAAPRGLPAVRRRPRLRRPRPARGRGPGAVASTWPRSRSPGCCRTRPWPAPSAARRARRTSSRCSSALELQLTPDDRERIGSFFA